MNSKTQIIIKKYTDFLLVQKEVISAWLSGSYGRGDFDEFSDIDISACIQDKDNGNDVLKKLYEIIIQDNEIVFSKVIIYSKTINLIDQNWNRCDITFIDRKQVKNYKKSEISVLFDKENIVSTIPENNTDVGLGNSPEKQPIIDNTEEFLRILGLLPVVIGREEFVVAQSGIFVLKDKLIKLMLLQDQNKPKRGALSLKKSLTDTQYSLLANLPSIDMTKESIIQGHIFLAKAFLPIAKELYQREHLEWPDKFVKAVINNLKNKIGVDLI